MLSENIAELRKKKGLSQEELAARLNVVRQTVSKWEKGKSAPDAEMLAAIAAELECSISTLLGENVSGTDEQTAIEQLSARMEEINLQLTRQAESRRRRRRVFFWIIGALAAVMLAIPAIEWFSLRAAINEIESTTAIIGGADGPTAIFVANPSPNTWLITIGILGLAISAAGIFTTRRKPE